MRSPRKVNCLASHFILLRQDILLSSLASLCSVLMMSMVHSLKTDWHFKKTAILTLIQSMPWLKKFKLGITGCYCSKLTEI